MKTRLTDVLLILLLFALPLFGVIQACGGNGVVTPDNGNGPDDGNGTPTDNHAPVAVLSVVGPEEGPTPFTVHLDASDSHDPDDDPLEYLWSFPDGEVLTESVVQYEFTSSGRYEVLLIVSDPADLTDIGGPVTIYSWGLADSPWPKFAHDERNSGSTDNEGPMMDLEHADEGGAWARYWRGGLNNDLIRGICIGYDGMVVYAQGEWLRARTPSGAALWDLQADSKIASWPAILHDGSIVVGTEAGRVHRVSESGDVMWSKNLTAEVGETVILDSAVNVGQNGNLYIGGYLDTDSVTLDERGRLFALSLDGAVLWSHVIPHFWIRIDKEEMGPAALIPALTPSGDVVINSGAGGHLYDPDGEQLAVLRFPPSLGYEPDALGPPSIGRQGLIIFNHADWPLYTSDGTFVRSAVSAPYYYEPSWYDPGRDETAVWGRNAIDILHISWPYDYHYIPVLFTRTAVGDTNTFVLKRTSFAPPRGAGAARDGADRIYVTAQGLQAVSRIHHYSVIPFISRHSLWTYTRETHFVTAPVIGEDNWLYLGYGTDIMALGD